MPDDKGNISLEFRHTQWRPFETSNLYARGENIDDVRRIWKCQSFHPWQTSRRYKFDTMFETELRIYLYRDRDYDYRPTSNDLGRVRP